MYNFIEVLDYNNLNNEAEIMLIEEENSDSFGLLEINRIKFGMSWKGKLKPTFELVENSGLLLIGAGSYVCIISMRLGRIKFLIGLHNPFAFFLRAKNKIFVISETTITIINLNIFCIERFTGVPDIILDGRIENENLILSCLSNEITINDI